MFIVKSNMCEYKISTLLTNTSRYIDSLSFYMDANRIILAER